MLDRTFAFIVGIGEYSDPNTAPALATAARDAAAIAARLQAMGVPPENMSVFLGTDETEFAALAAQLHTNTHVERSCDWKTLDKFWRQTLPNQPGGQGGNQLFVYWCGHGFTDAMARVPLLLCSDYTSDLTTRLVNRQELLEGLHSAKYVSFASQIILFDACANIVASEGTPGTAAGTWDGAINQVSVASAARGQYTHADASGGFFTRIVLDVLGTCSDWPDLDAFSNELKTRVEAGGQQSSLVRYSRGQNDDVLWRRSNPARDTLVALLTGLNLAPSTYRSHYQRAASSLSKERGRGRAVTIAAMVDDLWNANGLAAAPAAPHPVVEFVLRVRARFADETTALVPWIENPQFVQPADLAQARANLENEARSLFLAVELIESTSEIRTGEIVGFRALLLRSDHATAVTPGADGNDSDVARPDAAAAIPVSSWDDVRTTLLSHLAAARLIAQKEDARLTVEFVTNVFDIDPHRIEIDKLTLVGDEHPVVLRWRNRGQQSKDSRLAWLDQADQIRQGKPQTRVHSIDTAAAGLQPCYIVFVRHALPNGSRPRHPQPLTPEWRLVRRAIAAGAPFICWPVVDAGGGGWTAFESAIEKWVLDTQPLEDIPARVRQERAQGAAAAADANVFWDDPLTTYQLREIRMK